MRRKGEYAGSREIDFVLTDFTKQSCKRRFLDRTGAYSAYAFSRGEGRELPLQCGEGAYAVLLR